jgi:hypothetical protein
MWTVACSSIHVENLPSRHCGVRTYPPDVVETGASFE